MNSSGHEPVAGQSDAIEAVLAQAAPRPVPPGPVEDDIRAAVRAEWRAVARGRRSRRRAAFALAASIAMAVGIAVTVFRGGAVAPVEVATLVRAQGTFFMQGEDRSAALTPGDTRVLSGQVLTTGAGAAVGIEWNDGGSLRVDENTEVEFVSPREISLQAGRLYFDSAAARPGSGLVMRTPHGTVRHVGTQYLTESSPTTLVVSVREGRVSIAGTYRDETAVAGQRLELRGSGPAIVTNTNGTGADWEWTEAVAPPVDMQGKSTYEFLQWVGRETGHAVRFESESAERLARETMLIGEIASDPRTELRLRMMTVDLDARFDTADPSIVVSDGR